MSTTLYNQTLKQVASVIYLGGGASECPGEGRCSDDVRTRHAKVK